MNKKKIAVVIVIFVLVISGYVVFTLKSGEELNESSPLDQLPQSVAPQIEVKDSLETMSEETRRELEEMVTAVKENVVEMVESEPAPLRLLAQGDFIQRFHSVKGSALLITTETGQIVRFEDFETDNGPQLHIYLSKDLSADDFVDLGTIKATKGNVNYAVPQGTDTNKYKYVLVWCRPFGVLFSYANLKPL